MKSIARLPLLLILTLPFLNGCLQDECQTTRTFVRFDPVYLTAEEAHAALTVEAPRTMEEPGKIYAWQNYVFIGERYKGIHVIDNSNPEAPQPIAFWNLPGNVDLTIRGNYMYADQYMDLVTFDISNMTNPVEVCRLDETFNLFGFDPAFGYIIDYQRNPVTEEMSCSEAPGGMWFNQGPAIFIDAGFDVVATSSTVETNGGSALIESGIAGSYARFAQHSSFLYGIDNANLIALDVNNPACPQTLSTTPVGWNIETIFPWRDWLFIGSNTAVYIFDNRSPERPELAQVFWHATGCDPVICDDSHAYVTVRDGQTCNGTVNELYVIDIDQLPASSVQNTYQMVNPKGMAQMDDYLYVCDDGLKVFDKSAAPELVEVGHVKNIDATDAAYLGNNHLLVIGVNGLLQFDVSDPENPRQISRFY